jgi:hypothetical protein
MTVVRELSECAGPPLGRRSLGTPSEASYDDGPSALGADKTGAHTAHRAPNQLVAHRGPQCRQRPFPLQQTGHAPPASEADIGGADA